jgi:hypothetical protein
MPWVSTAQKIKAQQPVVASSSPFFLYYPPLIGHNAPNEEITCTFAET